MSAALLKLISLCMGLKPAREESEYLDRSWHGEEAYTASAVAVSDAAAAKSGKTGLEAEAEIAMEAGKQGGVVAAAAVVPSTPAEEAAVEVEDNQV